MDFTPDKWPRNDDKLSLFIACVERGQTPPEWLLEFMADGAREFLKGGKPWQKGKGGAPKSKYGQTELEAHILHFYGGLSPSEIVAQRSYPDDGKDYSRTIRREIDRGGLVLFLAKIGQVNELITTFSNLASLPFDTLSPTRAKKCRAGLKEEIQRLKRDQQEPGYE